MNYAKWTPDFNQICGDATRHIRVYCDPKYFEGVSNQLYHNPGNGTFEDVSKRAGIAGHIGRGMSVAFADYDGEGFTDIFVTNDKLLTFLFRNRGDATFEEVGLKPVLRCLNTQERLPAWESISAITTTTGFRASP